jgi:hypothetical protein
MVDGPAGLLNRLRECFHVVPGRPGHRRAQANVLGVRRSDTLRSSDFDVIDKGTACGGAATCLISSPMQFT